MKDLLNVHEQQPSQRRRRRMWGMGGTLVELTPFVRRVMGSTHALAAS